MSTEFEIKISEGYYDPKRPKLEWQQCSNCNTRVMTEESKVKLKEWDKLRIQRNIEFKTNLIYHCGLNEDPKAQAYIRFIENIISSYYNEYDEEDIQYWTEQFANMMRE